MEVHCYFSIAAFCTIFKFKNSIWNRYLNQREIIFCIEDLSTKYSQTSLPSITDLEILITPFQCEIVKVNEECSNDLIQVKVKYETNEDYKVRIISEIFYFQIFSNILFRIFFSIYYIMQTLLVFLMNYIEQIINVILCHKTKISI